MLIDTFLTNFMNSETDFVPWDLKNVSDPCFHSF